MSSKEARRYRRLPYSGTVRLSWEEPGRGQRFAQGKCVDLSESGVRIEMSMPVPLRATVALNVDRIQVTGAATVKHVVRYGAKYLVGVELTTALTAKALEALREPWALRSGTPL